MPNDKKYSLVKSVQFEQSAQFEKKNVYLNQHNFDWLGGFQIINHRN